MLNVFHGTNRISKKHSLKLLLCFAALIFSGAFCDTQDPDPAFGNYDRVSDLALLTPPDQEGDPHTYLVVANPNFQQLRIYDSYSRRFLSSDNVYFPLSIGVGPSTYQLTTPSIDSRRFFALDTAWHQIFAMRSVDESANERAFSHAREPIDIPESVQFLSSKTIGEVIYLVGSAPDTSRIYMWDYNPTTDSVESERIVELSNSAIPGEMHRTQSLDFIFIADQAQAKVHVLDLQSFAVRELNIPNPAQSFAGGFVDAGRGLEEVLVLTEAVQGRVHAYALGSNDTPRTFFQALGSITFPDSIVELYVPDQRQGTNLDARVCCPPINLTGDEGTRVLAGEPTTAWGSAMSADGRLYYFMFDAERPELYGENATMLKPFDTESAVAGPLDEYRSDAAKWFPSSGANTTPPEVSWIAIDNYGSPSHIITSQESRFVVFEWHDNAVLSSGGALEVYDETGDWVSQVVLQNGVGEYETYGLRVRIDTGPSGPMNDGDQIIMPLKNDLIPLSISLSTQPTQQNSNRFGRRATFPTAIVGGEIFLLPREGTERSIVRRMFISTAAGALIEMNETETNLDFVIGPQTI